MAYQLPDLPYAFDALEPHIDAKTMEIHHDKHHAAYVTNLNAALEGTEWIDRPIEAVLANLEILPADKQTARAQQRRRPREPHAVLGDARRPNGGGEPSGALGEAVAVDVRRVRRPQAADDRRRHQAVRLRLVVARLGRHRPRRAVDAEPGLAGHGRQDAAARDRRLGARLLPQVPEPAARLPRGDLERRRLGRRRRPLREARG